MLFSAGRFPLSVDPTVLPEGISGDVHYDPAAAEGEEDSSPYGFAGDGNELPAGATESSLMLGPLEEKLEGKDMKEGMGSSPTSVNYNPAMLAAKRMEKKIHDQLDESEATKQLRSAAFEMPLFGTGIMKGPMAVDKEYPDWDARKVTTFQLLRLYLRYLMSLCGTCILILMLLLSVIVSTLFNATR